jgi:1-deoxy-D-xylulose-5-phosphate reductoisomerase
MEMKILQKIKAGSIKKRSVTILGSTGSIGCNTLDLIKYASKQFEVVSLTGNENVQLLIEQAKIFAPKLAVIGNEELYNELKAGLVGTGVRVAAGKAALCEAAEMSSDIVIAGIVGMTISELISAASHNAAFPAATLTPVPTRPAFSSL